MRPEARDEHQPYWNDHRELGPVYVGHAERLVYVRSHVATERCVGRSSEPLFAVAAPSGERTYVQSSLYIYAPPETSQRFLLATTQSWAYPAERAVVFWECVLEPRYEPADPRESLLLRSLWLAYERFLISRFPYARRRLTTWEDSYGREAWLGFLNAIGYRQTAPETFAKPVSSDHTAGT